MPGDFILSSQVDTDVEYATQWREGISTLITTIQQAGMKVGIAIKPSTSIHYLTEDPSLVSIIQSSVDLILVMTVEPGFSGQAFMKHIMPKVVTVRTQFPMKDIQVDGGLAPDTVDDATKAGANVIVAASAIFNAVDRKQVMDQIRTSIVKYNK